MPQNEDHMRKVWKKSGFVRLCCPLGLSSVAPSHKSYGTCSFEYHLQLKVKIGADADDPTFDTALLSCVQHRNYDMVEFLLQNGANLILHLTGIFFCILALFVSIIIMGLLEVFVMFFDDSITVKTDIHRYDANNQTYLRSSNITTTTDSHSSLTTSTSSPASLIATTTSPPPPINPPPTTMTTTTFMHDNITNNTSNTSWSL